MEQTNFVEELEQVDVEGLNVEVNADIIGQYGEVPAELPVAPATQDIEAAIELGTETETEGSVE